jgi:hypothetical protein
MGSFRYDPESEYSGQVARFCPLRGGQVGFLTTSYKLRGQLLVHLLLR